jgi:large subunit ribosomal protein L10
MPNAENQKILEITQERIRDVRGFYLADFSGMSVESLSSLRKKCREQGIQFHVVKNTLLKRAFNARGISELDEFLVGPTGVVFSPTNEMSPAKVLADFARTNEKPRIKAAVVDGRLFNSAAVSVLASLPSREVLMSQVLGTIIAPMTTVLGAIDALLASPARLAGALEAKRNPSG